MSVNAPVSHVDDAAAVGLIPRVQDALLGTVGVGIVLKAGSQPPIPSGPRLELRDEVGGTLRLRLVVVEGHLAVAEVADLPDARTGTFGAAVVEQTRGNRERQLAGVSDPVSTREPVLAKGAARS